MPDPTHRPKGNAVTTTDPTAWPEGVIARYITIGGATVDLKTRPFTTRFLDGGRPFAGAEYRTVKGLVWHCHGCDITGGFGPFNEPYMPGERAQATRAANQHAETCRAMPKPETGRTQR